MHNLFVKVKKHTPVEKYAAKYGLTEKAVLHRISASILEGVEENGNWYVVEHVRRRSKKRSRRYDSATVASGVRRENDVKLFLRRWLAPHYDEITLLNMGLAFVLLFALSAEMRSGVGTVFDLSRYDYGDPRTFVGIFGLFVLAGFFCSGIIYSIYHAAVDRKKSSFERGAMLFFAVSANGWCGIVAGAVVLKSTTGWWSIFPIWNIVNGAALLYLFRFGIIDENSIMQEDANTINALVGAIATVILVISCQYYFRLHWALAYSICVSYATTVSRGVAVVLSGSRKAVVG